MSSPSTPTLDLEGRQALASVLSRLGSKPVELGVGRYVLGRALGKGGCGEVYLARDPSLDREVAIKVVLTGRDRDGTGQPRLLREAQAIARVSHPNVVEVYDVGFGPIGTSGNEARVPQGVYIVMERLRGKTLRDWQDDERPGADRILDAYTAAAEGLAAAHAQGVLHRDFKPTNAMITERGRIVVLDFGLAADLEHPSTPAVPSDDDDRPVHPGSGDPLTRTGTVVGTPRYMSPEQHSARPLSPATDQYSWCVSLWEALAGQPPFEGATLAELAGAKHRALPPTEAITPRIRKVLARGMDPDPAARFGSMGELVHALARARTRRRRGGAVGLAALGIVGVVGVAWARPAATDATEAPAPVCAANVSSPGTAEAAEAMTARLRAKHVRAEPLLQELHDRVRAFGDAWARARDSVCATTGPKVAAQSACLLRARARHDDAVAHVTEQLGQLPWLLPLKGLGSPDRCLGDDPVAAFDDGGVDPARLRQLRAAVEGGRGVDEVPSEQVLAEAVEVGERADDHALTTYALALRAHQLVMDAADFQEATETVSLAAWHARTAGDDRLAVEVVPDMLFFLIAKGAPPKDIDALLATSRESAAALGNPLGLQVRLDDLHGMALERRGDIDGALAKYHGNAMRLTEATAPELVVRRRTARRRIGELLLQNDDPWSGRPWLAQVATEPLDGPAEYVAQSQADLLWKLSEADLAVGDLAAALEHAERSIEAFGRAKSDGGWGESIAVEGWHGYLLGLDGELEAGRERLRDAVTRTRTRQQRPMLRPLLEYTAGLAELAGDHPAAIEAVTELRDLVRRNPESDERDVARLWAWQARLHARAGEPEATARALHQAQTLHARAEGDDTAAAGHLEYAMAAASGLHALAQQRPEEAVTHLQTALADAGLYAGTPLANGSLGELYWWLAQAQARLGHDADALAVADLAEHRLRIADANQRRLLLEVAAWKARRRDATAP